MLLHAPELWPEQRCRISTKPLDFWTPSMGGSDGGLTWFKLKWFGEMRYATFCQFSHFQTGDIRRSPIYPHQSILDTTRCPPWTLSILSGQFFLGGRNDGGWSYCPRNPWSLGVRIQCDLMWLVHLVAESTRIHRGGSDLPRPVTCAGVSRNVAWGVERKKEVTRPLAVGANQAPADAMGWFLFRYNNHNHGCMQ